jgi:hypothetical protein
MQVVTEVTLLKEGNVRVTNLRVVIGAKSYELSRIAAVRVHEKEPTLFIPIFLLLVAATCLSLIALTNPDDLSHYLTTGFYIIITTFLLFLFSRKTKYSVRIKTSVGELNIWEANDRERAERIVAAMRQAIGTMAWLDDAAVRI